jgi:indole-3-glycerol phosphate synthase
VTARRLSQAISEGDGISVLVEVRDDESARAATEQGAEGLVLRGGPSPLGDGSSLPVLAYGSTVLGAAEASADAVVLMADAGDDEVLVGLADHAAELGLEWVVKVRNEDDLGRVLTSLDPEILLIAAEGADDHAQLDLLLGLLPDIPAGKLAIADLPGANRAEIEELERAGVDAVIVASGNVDDLVGDSLPEL